VTGIMIAAGVAMETMIATTATTAAGGTGAATTMTRMTAITIIEAGGTGATMTTIVMTATAMTTTPMTGTTTVAAAGTVTRPAIMATDIRVESIVAAATAAALTTSAIRTGQTKLAGTWHKTNRSIRIRGMAITPTVDITGRTETNTLIRTNTCAAIRPAIRPASAAPAAGPTEHRSTESEQAAGTFRRLFSLPAAFSNDNTVYVCAELRRRRAQSPQSPRAWIDFASRSLARALSFPAFCRESGLRPCFPTAPCRWPRNAEQRIVPPLFDTELNCSSPVYHGFIWYHTNIVKKLDYPGSDVCATSTNPNRATTVPFGINKAGTVVGGLWGITSTNSFPNGGWVWRNGTFYNMNPMTHTECRRSLLLVGDWNQ